MSRNTGMEGLSNVRSEAEALDYLRRQEEQGTADAEVYYNLGYLEEKVGNADNAFIAYKKCIKAASRNPLAYLYAGYFCFHHVDKALACYYYSIVHQLKPEWFVYDNGGRQSGTSIRLQHAKHALEQYLLTQHRAAVGANDELNRVTNAVWPQAQFTPVGYGVDSQRPHLFYMPELRAQPVWQNENFPWVKELESQYHDIKDELLLAMQNDVAGRRPYLEKNGNYNGEMAELAGNAKWSALDLYQEGKVNDEVIKHFPKTIELLKAIPHTCNGEEPEEIFFSFLQPGQSIPEHYGLSNHSLTVHLPLVVPPACKLNVDDNDYHWKEGKIIVFDDSFIHSVINESSEPRIVLIFSVWHPDLTEAEKQAIKRTINTRKQWFNDAHAYFSDLIHSGDSKEES